MRNARERVTRSLAADRNGALDAEPQPMRDATFRAMVRKADDERDARDWAAAERSYAAALALDPDQAGYWIQHGHMLKEQGCDAEAEISYRTACALGAAAADVVEHLRFVLHRQGTGSDLFAIRFHSQGAPTSNQAPTRPAIETLARLVWHVGGLGTQDMVDLMRCATLDQALAQMIADPRFERANWSWLDVMREGDV